MDNFTTMTKAQLLEQIHSPHSPMNYRLSELAKERDGLRRELCQVIGSYHGEDAVTIAGERGWNCFENCTQVGGEWLVNEGKA